MKPLDWYSYKEFERKGFLTFIQTEPSPNPFIPPQSYKFGVGVTEMLRRQEQQEKDRLREEFWLDQGIVPSRPGGEE